MPGLNFDHIPPLHIPFRFFNTAPWMAVIGALVLLQGLSDASFSSQWSAELLALTHLFTLGFMAMIMLGALFQVLPVISGETIPAMLWVATVVHLALAIGTLLLAAAFVSGQVALFAYAVPVLLLAFVSFLLALGPRLVKKISGGDSINAIRFAALSLLLTVTLGALRALGYRYPEFHVEFANATTLHIAWGLAGWLSLLVMGVSFQVIPMFHVTPNFSNKLTKWLPLTVFVSLLLLSAQAGEYLQHFALAILCSALGFYAGYAIWLLGKRRRKLPDTTVNFWRLALGSLLLTVLLVVVRYSDQASGHLLLASSYASLNVVIGIVIIFGFACSVIIGMLHKIIPFLIYMHLQRQCGGNYTEIKSLPNMLDIIPVQRGKTQFYLHFGTLALLLSATVLSVMGAVAAVLIAFEFVYLGFTVNGATRLYWKTRHRISSSVQTLQ